MEPNKVLYSMTVMYGRPYARERRARDRRRAQEHADRQERDLGGVDLGAGGGGGGAGPPPSADLGDQQEHMESSG
jgi:hypothetical protein